MNTTMFAGGGAGPGRSPWRLLALAPIALAVAACGEPAERPGRVEAARAAPPAASEPLSVQYLGNEGFLVSAGADAVILDGLVRDGIPPYVRLPDVARAGLEAAEPPFDAIDVALASHFHSDHFDAGAVASFLRNSPRTEFVSTPQAAEQVRAVLSTEAPRDSAALARVYGVLPPEGGRERIELDGIVVQILNLHHGRNRNPPVENLGLLVTLGGWKILHIGDTMASLDEIAGNELAADSIDVAFVPYWRLLEDDGPRLVSEVISARALVVMHVPADDAPGDYFGRAGTRRAMVEHLRGLYPGAVILLEPLATAELTKE